MIWARTLASVVLVIMAGLALNIAINDSMGHGVGLDTFVAGAANPWQVFINQDLVSGLILTVSWMIYRERGGRAIDTVAWVWMAAWWGNIVVASYILLAAAQSGGDVARFFTGRRAGVPLSEIWRSPGPAWRGTCFLVAVLVSIYLLRGLLMAPSFIARVGYVLAFPPIILSALLLAVPRAAPALPAA